MGWKNDSLRALPAVDRLLQAVEEAQLEQAWPASVLREAARQAVEESRQRILEAAAEDELAGQPSLETVVERMLFLARAKVQPSLIPVINGTGTLLHTNLGRAPLATSALVAMERIAVGYSNLELDLAGGQRGQRSSHVESLLCELTGAEAALAVNNNAGAVMLALGALSGGRSAVVSRGELIEIGGSFRIPEVMAAAGAKLYEVGTTNKTHLKDYRNAIDDKTGVLLKVHTSNYRVMGFTAEVPATELVALGAETGVPVLEDLGSGMLFDLTPFGLPSEPTVADTVATGVDVVTFSGDKLLGGPQAGLLVGKAEAISRIKAHPMARALRIDKLTLAALEATLQLYRSPDRAVAEIPFLRMLAQSEDRLEQRSTDLVQRLTTTCGDRVRAEITPDHSQVGGGALPLWEVPGPVVALQPTDVGLNAFSQALRKGRPPVVGRIHQDRFLLNLRSVFPEQDETLLNGLMTALGVAD